jgi:hypothetical protein
MWKENDRGELEYSGGQEDWTVAAQIAGNCPGFKPDDEDEMVADEPISCYNCRFRRWTVKSFACLNQVPSN